MSQSTSKHQQSLEKKIKEFEDKSKAYEQSLWPPEPTSSSEPRAEEWKLKAQLVDKDREIKELNRKIVDLQRESDDHRQQGLRYKSDSDDYRRQKDHLEVLLQNQTEKSNSLTRQVNEYKIQIEEMIKQVDNADINSKMRIDEVEQIRKDYEQKLRHQEERLKYTLGKEDEREVVSLKRQLRMTEDQYKQIVRDKEADIEFYTKRNEQLETEMTALKLGSRAL